MLKAVPNKNAGFIILLTSIFTFFLFGEIRNLTVITIGNLMRNRNLTIIIGSQGVNLLNLELIKENNIRIQQEYW